MKYEINNEMNAEITVVVIGQVEDMKKRKVNIILFGTK